MVDAGFIEKHLYQEHPPRHNYYLTQRGEDFIPVLFVLLDFGSKHFAPDGPKVVVVNKDTAETAEPVLVDRKTGDAITSDRFTIGSTALASTQTRAKYALQACKPARARSTRIAKKTPIR